MIMRHLMRMKPSQCGATESVIRHGGNKDWLSPRTGVWNWHVVKSGYGHQREGPYFQTSEKKGCHKKLEVWPRSNFRRNLQKKKTETYWLNWYLLIIGLTCQIYLIQNERPNQEMWFCHCPDLVFDRPAGLPSTSASELFTDLSSSVSWCEIMWSGN